MTFITHAVFRGKSFGAVSFLLSQGFAIAYLHGGPFRCKHPLVFRCELGGIQPSGQGIDFGHGHGTVLFVRPARGRNAVLGIMQG